MILFCLFIAYLIAPKIDIVAIGEAAIRPEDFITLVAVVAFALMRREQRLTLPRPVAAYLLVVAANFAAAFANLGSEGIGTVIYAVRLLEYLVWFYIVREAAHHLTVRIAYRCLLLVAVVLIGWGWLEFFGVVGKIGRFAGAEGRLSINTSGPFEASVMLATFAYALPGMLLTPNLLLLTWFTEARITIVGVIGAYLTRNPARSLPIIAIGGVAALLLAAPIANLLGATRFAEVSPAGMVEFLSTTYRKAQVFENTAYFRRLFATSLDGFGAYFDMRDPGASFNLRAVRWSIAVKSTLEVPGKLWLGFGPGAFGVALDGFYFRAFGETGLLGLIALLAWLAISLQAIDRRSVASYQLTLMAIVAVFIDIFTSSKAMPLYWGFLALEQARHPLSIPRTAAGITEWYRALATRYRGTPPATEPAT